MHFLINIFQKNKKNSNLPNFVVKEYKQPKMHRINYEKLGEQIFVQ
jgi:hypothetical protein